MRSGVIKSLVMGLCLLVQGSAICWAEELQGNVGQQPEKSDELRTALAKIQLRLSESEKSLDAQRQDFDAKIKDLAPKNQAAFDALRLSLEKLRLEQEQAQAQLRTDRIHAGQLALEHMTEKVKIIDFVHELVKLDLIFNEETNIWSDADFRNGWDKVQTIGNVLGVALAAVPAFVKDNTAVRDSFAGISIGVLALGNLLGGVFGKFGFAGGGDAKGLSKKMQLLQLSRRAYDDLAIRKKLIEDFHSQNAKFRGVLEGMLETFTKAPPDQQERMLPDLVSRIEEFDTIVRQIPTLLSTYDGFVSVYLENPELDESLATQLKTIAAQVKTTRTKFEVDIEPILKLKPDLRRVLLYGSR